MPGTTVQISFATRETLRLLAAQTGESMQSILDKAIETHRRQLFLEHANAAFSALQEDSEAWQAEQEERAAWDATIADGLKEA